MILTRTPYRISFFGGGTDYPEWFETHGGAVLGTSIDKYCWIACRKTLFSPRYRIVCSKVEECDSIDEIRHPAVRECLRFMEIEGVEIHYWGDLPARSGMGSSSAFVVGLLHALRQMKGLKYEQLPIAEEAIHIERNVLKENVGCQDQYLTCYGGFNRLQFKKGAPVERDSAMWDSRLDELSDHLMLFYTGIERTASDVASTYIKDFLKKERTLFRLRDMVEEARAILWERKDLNEFGELLHESWELKKSLGAMVSTRVIDGIYLTALGSGAIGGKLLGAGGGGFLLLFVPPEDQDPVRKCLMYQREEKVKEAPFEFEFTGSTAIEVEDRI